MKFTELSLVPGLQAGIEEAGFVECTPVQERTFQETFKARDVLVQSQTGTGKTAAFLVTIFQLFSTKPEQWRKALVVVPTRELAVQVEEEAQVLGTRLNFTIGSIFGGVGYGPQQRLLDSGVDILVGTPGRLLDLAGSRRFSFGEFDTLVIDEADRMFDMGFFPDMRRILREMPDRSKRLTMLFSATLSTRVRNLAWEYMNGPAEIEVTPEQVTVNEITQELYHVTAAEKLPLLLGILKKDQPRNALIFANMKFTVVELAKRLTMNGYPTRFIMGDLPQRKRLSLINGIKSGEIKFLVATDVAARGLHIEGLDLVVNYDLPEDFEIYVHRIGRTARAGRAGKAISFACEQYVYGLPAIENFIGMKIPVSWADDTMFEEDKSAGIDLRREIRIEGELEPFRRGREGSRGRSSRQGDRARSGERRPAAGRGRERSRQGPPSERAEGRGSLPPRTAKDPRKSVEAAAGSFGEGHEPVAERREPRYPKAPRPAVPHRTQPAPQGTRPGADAPLEERLSYYREKYGENFRSGSNGKAGSGDGRRSRPQGGGSTTEGKPAPRMPAAQAPIAPPPKSERPNTLFGLIKGLFKKK